METKFPVMLGSDNERHHTSLFGDTSCGAEHLWDEEDQDDGFSLIDTGETDVTCPACLEL